MYDNFTDIHNFSPNLPESIAKDLSAEKQKKELEKLYEEKSKITMRRYNQAKIQPSKAQLIEAYNSLEIKLMEAELDLNDMYKDHIENTAITRGLQNIAPSGRTEQIIRSFQRSATIEYTRLKHAFFFDRELLRISKTHKVKVLRELAARKLIKLENIAHDKKQKQILIEEEFTAMRSIELLSRLDKDDTTEISEKECMDLICYANSIVVYLRFKGMKILSFIKSERNEA